MSYVPPSLRKYDEDPLTPSSSASNPNIFASSDIKLPTSPPAPAPDLNAEELFPSLGSETTVKNSHMNFASSLFNPEPKSEPDKKDIPDGWVRLQKNGDFIYGDKSETYDDFQVFLEIMEELRVEGVENRILDRYEEYLEWDLMVNGPKYLNGWEISQYIEDQKAEAKRAARNCASPGDSSDDGNSSNEFN